MSGHLRYSNQSPKLGSTIAQIPCEHPSNKSRLAGSFFTHHKQYCPYRSFVKIAEAVKLGVYFTWDS